MDLRQLETFCAIMESGSLSAAARQTGRSSSALTRMVQDLEQRLGFPLFHRNGPRITPTERGLLFHDEVERSLAGLRAIEARAAALARGENERLLIAAVPALASGLVPAALGRLATLPESVSLLALPSGEVVNALLDRRMDLGFVSLPFEQEGLTAHWSGEAQCVAVLSAEHPLATLPELPLSALDGQPVITVADARRLRRRIDLALEAASVRPSATRQANASLTAMAMARAGLGIALIDPVTAIGLPLQGVVMRPVDAAIPFLWSVVTPSSRPPGEAARQLIAAAAEVAAHLPGFVLHQDPGNAPGASLPDGY